MGSIVTVVKSPNSLEPYRNKVEACPMCGRVSAHPEMRVNLFKERDHDVDLRPKSYIWSLDYLTWCHPPIYYMWNCPNCPFTAANEDFADPATSHGVASSTFEKGFKESQARGEFDQVVRILRKPIDQSIPRSFLGGFALHLLSIYLLEPMDEVNKEEPLQFANYFLRTAWLFRDIEEHFPQEKARVDALLAELSPHWPTMPGNEKACLERAAELLETGLETSSMIKSKREEIELILLIARICMKIGDSRKAKNLGLYSRERLEVYETQLELKEHRASPEELAGGEAAECYTIRRTHPTRRSGRLA